MTSLLNSIKQVLNEEKQNLEEKSVSQSQQKLMGMAYALKKGEMEEKDASPEVKKLADSMTLKDLKDFASTKHDEIPAKKEEVELDEIAMADTEYSRAHNSAKDLTKKANTSMKLDHIIDAIKAHKKALKYAKSDTNKAAHTGHIRDLSKKIAMAEEVELDEAYRWSTINRACMKLNMSPREIANLLSALKKVNGASSGDDETYTWNTINKACMKLNMSPREIANLLSALKKVNEEVNEAIKSKNQKFMKKYDPSFFKEGVEVDARRKSFKEALKRIEGYKAKRSIKTEGKEEYEKFFKSAMKKFGITNLGDLDGKKEKEFYDYVDANWKAKDESTIEKVRKIVNEKRKQRAKAMNEVDEPSSQNDKDLVNFHKRNTQVKSDI